jgi:hypothetical protein
MKSRILTTILILLSVTACNATFEVGLEHSPTAIPSQVATFTTIPTPSATLTLPVVIDPQPSPTVQAPGGTLAATEAPSQNMVQIYLIAVGDNGQTGTLIGCGDSAVPVQVEIQPTQAVLKAALVALLSIKDQYYGQSGLYNALYQSDLQVESVSINNGKASVYLAGTLLMGGECDIPRVKAQLEQTVLQFPTVSEADIFINGKTLTDALSLKGLA